MQELRISRLRLTAADKYPSQKLINAAGSDVHSSVTQVPTLTCFIMSLDCGEQFRISIHSWTEPKPSGLLLQFNPPSGQVVFESKLFIDGQLKAQKFLGVDGSWPAILGRNEEALRLMIILTPNR